MYKHAWMAGFIDGEAWIGISKQIRKERPSPTYRAVVAIANQKRCSLAIFEQEYLGKVRMERDCYRWYCPRESLEKMLEDIMPFLVIKREQAQLLLDYTRHVHAQYGCRPTEQTKLRVQEKFYQAMKALNKHTFREEQEALLNVAK